MKRLLSITAAAVLIFTAAPTVTSYAEKKDESKDFYYQKTDNNEICVTDCVNTDIKELMIPETIDGLPVTSIGKNAFFHLEEMTSCVIPDSVTSIDKQTFVGCPKLITVSIGSGVSSIGEFSFADSLNLTSFTVSKDNPTYSSVGGCLFNKSGDTLILYAGSSKAVVPDKTKTIADFAFFERADITSVTIPDSVKTIGENAFSGCLELRSVDIPDSVTTLSARCFMSCTSLSKVRIGSGVTAIPDKCFLSCTALNNIIIPDNITSIGYEAFYSCAGLSGIKLPKSVTSIGENALGRRYNTYTGSTQNIPNFVIKGEKGSAAEKYASDCGIIFGTRICQKGDVTGDGIIDAVDASAVLTEYALISTGSPLSFNAEQNIAADYDDNGTANAVDASLILEKYAENAVKH